LTEGENLLKYLLPERQMLSYLRQGGGKKLVEVRVDDYGSFSQALKRFKIECQQSGLTSEIKKHQEYEKPTERKRKKRLKAIRRQRRKMRKLERLNSL